MSGADDALRAYYAARSAEYERIYAKPERQPDLRRLEALLPPLVAGCGLLEVACGTGYWTARLARSARRVVAVDAVAEVLALAADKELPAGRVRFVRADAYALPGELGTFDAAFAGFWWSHVPRRSRRRFLQSLDARLRPGARVVLLDNRYVEGSSTPIARRDAEGDTWQRRRLDDGSVHEVLKNFPGEDELRAEVAPFAAAADYTALDHYWLLEYRKPR